MSAKKTQYIGVRLFCYIMLAVSPEVVRQLSTLKTSEDVAALIWTQWICIAVSIALPMWAVIRAYLDQSYGRIIQEDDAK
jgi:hypothetical protein